MNTKRVFVLAYASTPADTVRAKFRYFFDLQKGHTEISRLVNPDQLRGWDNILIIQTERFEFGRDRQSQDLKIALKHYCDQGKIILWLREEDWWR